MKLQACLSSIMVVLMMMTGCDRRETDSIAKVETKKEIATTQTYQLKGVVRKVDPESGEVSISHEEIVGFMPKMTMPFSVDPGSSKKTSLLQGVKPGDEVEGMIRVDRDGETVKDLKLTDLKVIRSVENPPPTIVSTEPSTDRALKPGDVVPDFLMTTQEGKPLNLADLQGKVVVLSFIYTRCPSPEFCPAMDTKFAELARRIGAVADRADRVRLLSVSFDPDNDTPAILTAHAGRRGAKPPLWTFAVASHQELGKIAGPLGLTYVPGTREIDHNLRAAVIGPDGRLAAIEVGKDWTPTDVLKKVYELIPDGKK